MAFGFLKRDKGPLEVACPACQHRQEESPLAVSTFCKKCNTYLKIEDGVAQAPDAPSTPTFKPSPKTDAEPKSDLASKLEGTLTPVGSPQKAEQAQKSKSQASAPKDLKSEAKVVTPPAPDVIRKKPKLPERPKPPLLQNQQTKPNPNALKRSKTAVPGRKTTPGPIKVREKVPTVAPEAEKTEPKDEVPFVVREAGPDDRMVRCFDCSVEHPTSKNSTSALCPKCGAYISLKDFEIKDDFNSRIQTRGHVFIHKKGVVSSSIIQCHSLTVEGEFTGAAECSGELIIRRHSRIEGEVSCDQLRVEKRAKVEFLKGVKTKGCEIDGLVEGNITCSGRLALHKKATLHGDIKVGTLSIDAGAKHHGQISMGQF